MDCHVETFRAGVEGYKHRAQVIHTATGVSLYTTWPYASEQSARDRARRWMREEYRKNEFPDELGLFSREDAEVESKDGGA